jgi:NAD(P)-dependent dehydrogenase (short-subunit alcohol dehydrogenase family)
MFGPSSKAHRPSSVGRRRVISEGVARFGQIDTPVNNAGIYIGKPFTEYTAEDYAAVMNVNMAGFYYITQLAIAEMEKRSSGHVVSVTTSIDQVAISGIYSVLAAMTKGGLNAATKSLAIEYAKKGIRVNAVAPGNIKTPMHAPEAYEALGAFNPIGRIGETSDIADAILFLDSLHHSSLARSCTSTAGKVLATELRHH